MSNPHKALGRALAGLAGYLDDQAARTAAIMAARDAEWQAWRRDNPGVSPLRMTDRDGLTWDERGGM